MSKFDKNTKRDKYFLQRDKELDNMIDPKTGKIFAHLTEKINCVLCDSPDFNVLFSKNGFDFVRCGKCSHVYVNPRLTQESILKHYNDDSKSNAIAFETMMSLAERKENAELYKYFFDKLNQICPKGRILDIGCSLGQFLKTGKDMGYDCLGLELNEAYAKYAEDNYKIKVERKTLEQCDFNDQSFDIVSMFGVIEHLSDPVNALRDVHRILKPGGVFLGMCPNVQSMVCMVLHQQSRTFTGQLHLSYFSQKTLQYLFDNVGFKKSDIKTYISGKDSLLNYFQFLDPFGDECYDYLPDKLKEFLSDDSKFACLQNKMCELGMGLRLKFFAEKQ